jgi:iron complex transport system ATP-binding protein
VPESPAISLAGVSACYGAVEALRDLSLTFLSGSFTAVLGPNGAGKSTLVRALTRVVASSGGTIRYGKRELREISQAELARTVAVVPQDVWVPFSYTVLEMVLMGRAPHLGMLGWEGEEDLAKARAALERLELLHLEDRPLPNLSGGERQRVLLARALAQEAPILILDEPTAHLDIAHQQRTLELMAELHREGRTVIAVLHDLNLASLYCPRLVLLHEGGLAADGPPAEVLTESRLAQVYGAAVTVLAHPASGSPVVLPSPPSRS